MKIYLSVLLGVALLTACSGDEKADAYGNFESTSVTVSAKGAGELLRLKVKEGSQLKANETVGLIDTTQLHLQKLQIKANIEALDLKLQEAAPEVAVLIQDRENLIRERNRTKKLLEKKAATSQQLDDFNGKIDLLTQRINSTRENVNLANRRILAERKPLHAQLELIQQQISDNLINNPISGTVLTQFAEVGELMKQGSPLYKIANLNEMTLRAYASAVQIQNIQLGDKVVVLIDSGESAYQKLQGTINYIASEAEFTPKTIETKEERVNLVYAIEVRVANNGNLKIGMPGEVLFNTQKE